MSDRKSIPEIEASALRARREGESIERIWQRLEPEVTSAPARRSAALWWAPAAALIVFGSGVVVGARWAQPPAVVGSVPLVAEPIAPVEPEQAAQPAAPSGGEEPSAPADAGVKRSLEHAPAVHAPRAVLAASGSTEVPAAPVAAAATPEWQRLANNGEWAAARRALDEQGGFDAAIESASAEQLMTLADIARFAKPVQSDRALAALRRVLARFPGDPNAPVAAYTLGNMLDKAGDRAGAAQAFAAYRSLSPKGDFAEDALAREIEVAVEQGNLALAKELADQYARDFPRGRRRAEIRAELAKLAGDAGAALEADGGALDTPGVDDSLDEAEGDEPVPSADAAGAPAR
ncbi:MAG: hypothetical protein OZ921_19325 [Sorangiineae bacterium]|nr:hypothetical protein [Polyangiaceae bacterium]MEB2324676.1 hypothetical protein [Sorangiineae bacterium]